MESSVEFSTFMTMFVSRSTWVGFVEEPYSTEVRTGPRADGIFITKSAVVLLCKQWL